MIGISVFAPPLFLALALTSPNTQASPDILHEPLDCVAVGQYPVIDAIIQPESDVRTAKVYFRSDKYPKFYFVEMAREGDTFRCVLPKPSIETDQIIYYIEAIDVAFNNTIGGENTAEVHEKCIDAEPTAYPLVEEPKIIVGATEAGVAPFPPGFQMVGIAGTVTSAGLLSGVGGGPGLGTAVAIGAAAVGAGGVAAQLGRAPATTTVSAAEKPATSSTTSTASATTIPGATSTIPGATTTVPTATTTTTVGTTTTTAVVTTTTTSVPPATTTTSTLPLTACFTASDADGDAGCKMNFDASCSTGDIVNYEWRFQDNPPVTVSGPSETASYDWSSDPACSSPFTRLVKLTVTASDSSTAQTQSNVNPYSPGSKASVRAAGKRLPTSFSSFLQLPWSEGRLEAHVLLNRSQLDRTDNTAPHNHRMIGKPGRNTVEGYVTSPGGRAVFWRFDFAACQHFEPGSIRVEKGVVASQEAYAVVFRLSGTSGERIQFDYRLSTE